MDIGSLLKDKKFVFKERTDGLLFEIDWDAVRRTNRCPYCGNKLYPSLKFIDSILCRSKKHRFFKIKKFNAY